MIILSQIRDVQLSVRGDASKDRRGLQLHPEILRGHCWRVWTVRGEAEAVHEPPHGGNGRPEKRAWWGWTEGKLNRKKRSKGSSCGSVGRAVASDSRGPRFESSHRQNIYIEHLFTVNCIEKTKITEKEAGIGPLFKKRSRQKIRWNIFMKMTAGTRIGKHIWRGRPP